METAPGPILEFTCTVDREFVDALNSWLARHIEDSLQNPGISAAELYQQEDDEQGRARRVAHFYFFSDSDLEQYLAQEDDVESSPAIDEFAGHIQTSRRILRHADIVDGELKSLEVCLNCSTTLSGQYCGNCGQRATSRLISVWELLKDAFGDLLELDSRLWRTLVPLMVRPGRLTRDYLEGRRARYMPPFRMYLVLSIVFFLVAFFDPREELGILFEPALESTADEPQKVTEAEEIREEIFRDLADEGILVGTLNDDPDAATEDTADAEDDNELTVRLSTDEESAENCDLDSINTTDWPPWLSSRLTADRLKAACDRVIADDGSAFLRKLLDNVPAALFVLLPLMALVLKILYPLSKRFYVEHLLFVVHYHAFVFLILSLQVLLTRMGALAHIPETPVEITILAASLYVPVYLYKSLRQVYGQSGLFTVLKFMILVFAYFAGLLIVFALVALFAAFSL